LNGHALVLLVVGARSHDVCDTSCVYLFAAQLGMVRASPRKNAKFGIRKPIFEIEYAISNLSKLTKMQFHVTKFILLWTERGNFSRPSK